MLTLLPIVLVLAICVGAGCVGEAWIPVIERKRK
jgi:hypothetical protein